MTTSEVAHALLADDNAKWSREAAYAIAEYYEALEQDSGEEIEFDRVAIRCDFDENSPKDVADSYDIEGLDDLDPESEEFKQIVNEYLEEKSGYVIELDNGNFLYIENF